MKQKLETAFNIYLKACYKTTPPPAIRDEIKQAFYGGALIAFEVISELSELPEDQAFAGLDAMRKECFAYARERKIQFMNLKHS